MLWSAPIDFYAAGYAIPTLVGVGDEWGYASDSEGRIIAFELATGEEVWASYTVNDPGRERLQAVISEGVIYGDFYAIDGATGESVWAAPPGSLPRVFLFYRPGETKVALVEDILVFSHGSYGISAFVAKTGEPIFHRTSFGKLPQPNQGEGGAVDDGNVLYYAASQYVSAAGGRPGGVVAYGVDPATGRDLWEAEIYTLEDMTRCAQNYGLRAETEQIGSQLQARGGIAFLNYWACTAAVDMKTGDILWRYFVDTPISSLVLGPRFDKLISGFALIDGAILIGGLDSYHVIDEASGELLWKFSDLGGRVRVAGDLLYALDYEAQSRDDAFGATMVPLRVFDLVTGEPLREYDICFEHTTTVPVTDEVIYITCSGRSDSVVEALDAVSGETLWSTTLKSREAWSLGLVDGTSLRGEQRSRRAGVGVPNTTPSTLSMPPVWSRNLRRCEVECRALNRGAATFATVSRLLAMT